MVTSHFFHATLMKGDQKRHNLARLEAKVSSAVSLSSPPKNGNERDEITSVRLVIIQVFLLLYSINLLL